jgi:hypothetical protein
VWDRLDGRLRGAAGQRARPEELLRAAAWAMKLGQRSTTTTMEFVSRYEISTKCRTN